MTDYILTVIVIIAVCVGAYELYAINDNLTWIANAFYR